MSKDLRTSVLLQPRWGALPPPPFTVYHVINDVNLVIFKFLGPCTKFSMLITYAYTNMMRKEEQLRE